MPEAPRPKVCVRKLCGRCLFCQQTKSKCVCTDEIKAGDPTDVMYGWCHKCREKFKDQYQALTGTHCTYCGGQLEDNYPPLGVALAVLIFPIGVILCCTMKEKQCVICNRSFS